MKPDDGKPVRNSYISLGRNSPSQDGILVTKKPYGEDDDMRDLAVVPNGFRTMLISENHDTPEGAHRDYVTTLSYLRRFYFWKGMRADTQKFCSACIICALMHSGKGKGIMIG